MRPHTDTHTVALWLFDEPDYANMTLTDASVNHYDLRLRPGGALVPGRFGNCLKIGDGILPAAVFAEKPNVYQPPLPIENRPTVVPLRLLEAIHRKDWTLEFWLKVDTAASQQMIVFEASARSGVILKCSLFAHDRSFLVTSNLVNFSLLCPTAERLTDGQWHHVAFVQSAQKGKAYHFVDGVIQEDVRRVDPVRAGLKVPEQNYVRGTRHELRIAESRQLIEIGPAWRFCAHRAGDVPPAGWALPGFDDGGWTTVYSDHERGRHAHGVNSDGYGLYRTAFAIPDGFFGQEYAYLLFEAVDGECAVYVNGQQVCQHTMETTGLNKKEIWQRSFTADVKHLANSDEPNVVAIEVKNFHPGGAVFRPVYLIAEAQRTPVEWLPGLIGVEYKDDHFHEPRQLVANPLISVSDADVSGNSCSWKGFMRWPVDGPVSFDIKAEGDFSLEICGQTIIEVSHGVKTEQVVLADGVCKRGAYLPLEIRYSATGKDEGFTLGWSAPAGQERKIPPAVFYHSLEDNQSALWEVNGKPHRRDFNLALGSDRNGFGRLGGCIDEMRFSDIARYDKSFDCQESLSTIDIRYPVGPDDSSGDCLPLLFAKGSGDDDPPLQLGSRKHLFIDDAILDEKQGVRCEVNPPRSYDMVMADFHSAPWETGSCYAPTVYEHKGRICLNYTNNFMWLDQVLFANGRAQSSHVICQAVSDDGISFEKPQLGLIEWQGGRDNNILMRWPVQGRFFIDSNPDVPAEEKFKFTGYYMTRGIYLFTSPDGIHWRRNETIMLPFDCGGGVECFWDNQQQQYLCYVRNEGLIHLSQRRASVACTNEPRRPWPFEPSGHPMIFYAFSLPTLDTELPIPFKPTQYGQINRTGARKYSWAPDTYVAFALLHVGENPTAHLEVELAVSRDGLSWQYCGQPFYLAAGFELAGEKVKSIQMAHGDICRGNEIWNYALVHTVGNIMNCQGSYLLRYRQRLDGYVAMTCGGKAGYAITRPMVFCGDHLKLNVIARGSVKVGVLDINKKPVAGFEAQQCRTIQGDYVDHVVQWESGGKLTQLNGKPIRLCFEMTDAKLFAFQFSSTK